MPDQLEFSFDSVARPLDGPPEALFPERGLLPRDRSERGYGSFMSERAEALRRLEERFGVILNKQVRVTLAGFPGEFVGKLVLDQLFVPEGRQDELRLRIDQASFEARDMESCVLMET